MTRQRRPTWASRKFGSVSSATSHHQAAAGSDLTERSTGPGDNRRRTIASRARRERREQRWVGIAPDERVRPVLIASGGRALDGGSTVVEINDLLLTLTGDDPDRRDARSARGRCEITQNDNRAPARFRRAHRTRDHLARRSRVGPWGAGHHSAFTHASGLVGSRRVVARCCCILAPRRWVGIDHVLVTAQRAHHLGSGESHRVRRPGFESSRCLVGAVGTSSASTSAGWLMIPGAIDRSGWLVVGMRHQLSVGGRCWCVRGGDQLAGGFCSRVPGKRRAL